MKNKFTKFLAAGVALIAFSITSLASPMLADLSVDSLSFDESGKVVFTLSNSGSKSVNPDSIGGITVFIDGKRAWHYNWTTLKNNEFLSEGGATTITSQVPRAEDMVRVCIDSASILEEVTKVNNCKTLVLRVKEENNFDPAIASVNVNPNSDDLIVTIANLGSDTMLNANGKLTVYEGDKLLWSYLWSEIDRDFLNGNGKSYVKAMRVTKKTTITACLSTNGIDMSKSNNCKTIAVEPRVVKNLVKNTVKKPENNFENLPIAEAKPDLYVKSIVRNSSNVSVTIANKGGSIQNLSKSEARINISGSAQVIKFKGTVYNSLLRSNGTTSLSFPVNNGVNEIEVCLDITNEIKESRESNNCMTIEI